MRSPLAAPAASGRRHERFDQVAPLLELLQEGALVSPELLKTEEELELEHALAHDRLPTAAEDAQIAELLRA